MSLTVLNDVHLGVQRAAGTTPLTALLLRKSLQSSFAAFVTRCDEPLLINGDLFDGYDVDRADVLQCFRTLSEFSRRQRLILVAGNHDLSKDSHKLSAFEWMAQVLQATSKNVELIMQPAWLPQDRVYVIPHLVNQAALDEAIDYLLDDIAPAAAAQDQPIKFCLFHANYDNHFAAQADHSLNVSQEQALRLIAAGIMPVFGHEHPKRVVDLGDGNVLCTGNQWPSSVSDCIGSTGKFAHRLFASGNYESIQTWTPEGSYAEIAWRELDQASASVQFIRVVGEATFEESAEAVAAVSRLRQKSEAFVITNAVKMAGAGDDLTLAEGAEVAQKIDVMNLLLDSLDEREAARVQEALRNDN